MFNFKVTIGSNLIKFRRNDLRKKIIIIFMMLYLYKQKMKFNSERNIVVNCMKCHKSISYRVILMIVIEDIY